MPQTHLVFDPSRYQPPTAEIILSGVVVASPLVTYNGVAYCLFASYTHTDLTTENLYRPLFNCVDHDNYN